MRLRATSTFRFAAFALTWPVPLAAQSPPAAPPPMSAGGLAPPPRNSGPPPPPPPQTTPTQLALEAAQEQDSGRGLEFVYFQVEGGFEFAALDGITKTGDVLPPSETRSAVGPLVGVASGVRLLYLTIGPRFRFAHTGEWDLWTLNLDMAWHVPLGKLEPHGQLGAGYAKVGRSADKLLGTNRGVTISGFDVRLGGGVDYYFTNVFSLGANLDVDLLRFSRSAVALRPTDAPAVAAFGASASSVGVAVTTAAVAGFHF